MMMSTFSKFVKSLELTTCGHTPKGYDLEIKKGALGYLDKNKQSI